MATPQADTHRDAQAVIAAGAAALAAKAWADLDLGALRVSLPLFKLQIAAVVRQYSLAATTAALQHYVEQRQAAGIAGSPGFDVPEPPPLEQVSSGVEWAAQPLWGKSDVATAEKRLDSMVERLVLNAGRDTIVGAVHQDRQARGWARVPEPGACAFCALLSTRGAVYKTEESAGAFKFHDNCRCHVEPTFTAYEPTAQVRRWQADHKRLGRESGGSVSLQAWRQHYDATYLADQPS